MGNTNIPQAGAEGTTNGRDTRSGDDQLVDAEKRERDHGVKPGVGPAPSRPKNAPPRIPGQQRNAQHAEDDASGSTQNDRRRTATDDGGQLAPDDPYNPRNTTGAGDPDALRSHVPSGRSPSDAT